MAYLYGVDLTEPVDLPGAIYKKYSDFSENNMIISGKAGKGGFSLSDVPECIQNHKYDNIHNITTR
jgi:hypothetical protein